MRTAVTGPAAWMVLLFLARSMQAAEFEIALWPGEGRPVLEATSPELELRENPSWSSCPTRVDAEAANSRITFDDTRYRTVRAGEATALRKSAIEGRDLGEIRMLSRDGYYDASHPAALATVLPGQTIEYLQPRAEGTCFVRIHHKVIDADPCPVIDAQRFRLTSEPVIEWWAHVEVHGRSGWTLVNDEQLKVVDRTF